MDKVFAVAGVSTLEGAVKARFAKDLTRVKVLVKNGHTAVRLVELPNEMDKEDALTWLRQHPDFQDAEAQAALAPEVKAEPKVKAPKAAKVAKEPKAVAEPTTEAGTEPAVDATAEVEKPAKKAKAKAEPKEPSEVEAIRAKNRELMRQTFEKIKERQAEEAEEATQRDAEAKELEVDNHMSAFLV